MNVYDFDKTIYDGDSTFNFYKYCLKKKPTLIFGLWRVFIPFILYLFGKGTKTAFKEKIYESFLPKIDRESYLSDFWQTNVKKIKKFYLDIQREDDIIISASPVFIVKPCTDMLGIKHLYASNVDPDTGKYSGINCHGEEKVRRFDQAGFKRFDVEEFYSDSLSDTPLAKISKKAFIVSGEKLIPWESYKPSTTKKLFGMFLSPSFLRFLLCGCASTLVCLIVSVIALWLIPDFSLGIAIFTLSDAVLSHFIGYAVSLPFSYVVNSKFSFERKLCPKEFLKFCISYIPNYIIQMITVFLLADIAQLDKTLSVVIAVIIGIPVTFLFLKLFAFRDKKNSCDEK